MLLLCLCLCYAYFSFKSIISYHANNYLFNNFFLCLVFSILIIFVHARFRTYKEAMAAPVHLQHQTKQNHVLSERLSLESFSLSIQIDN